MSKSESVARPSLHQLAMVLAIPYARLASQQVAYKPIQGQPYTKDINWEAVDAFVERRLDKTEYSSVEDVMAAALEVEYTPKGRRTADPNSVWGKMLFGTTPMRKGNLKEGDIIRHKKSGTTGKVVFVNDTIVCYDEITEDGSRVPTNSIGNRVFNNQFEIVNDDEAAEVAQVAEAINEAGDAE